MEDEFRDGAAAELRPEAHRLYEEQLEALRRHEAIVDGVMTVARSVRSALAVTCRIAAGALRALARAFELAAQRLSLTR